jgi:hypothetical protein
MDDRCILEELEKSEKLLKIFQKEHFNLYIQNELTDSVSKIRIFKMKGYIKALNWVLKNKKI